MKKSMIKVRIEMPKNAGMEGPQDVELPFLPRVGEMVKDSNNRYYRVIAVAHHPFEHEELPKVLVNVSERYATTPDGEPESS